MKTAKYGFVMVFLMLIPQIAISIITKSAWGSLYSMGFLVGLNFEAIWNSAFNKTILKCIIFQEIINDFKKQNDNVVPIVKTPGKK